MSAPQASSSEYWTITEGVASRTGWSCRECKRVIGKGENIVVRDGRKMRYFFHAGCFSGSADPRTQPSSSYKTSGYALSEAAPAAKGKGKWTVRPETYGYHAASAAGAGAPTALPPGTSAAVFGLPPLSAGALSSANARSASSLGGGSSSRASSAGREADPAAGAGASAGSSLTVAPGDLGSRSRPVSSGGR